MLTIAWDVDDVLNECMDIWFENWRRKHPHLNLKYEDLKENPPYKILGISKEEYLTSLDEFRLSFYKKMPPLFEVKQWFLKKGKFFRHLAVTAVPLNLAHISGEWVLRHFGNWIRIFCVVPSLRRGVKSLKYDKNKKEFFRWFSKVDIFIDDNESNIQECEKLGIKCILFPRPWNQNRLTIKETLAMIG